MKVGQQFKIYFQENITTGYQWVLLEEELAYHGLKNKVSVVNLEHIKPEVTDDTKGPVMLGSPGTRIITIEALESTVVEGEDDYNDEKEMNTLHFILCRPWEL